MCRLLTTVIFHIKGLLLLFINLLLLFTIIIIGISIIIVYGVAQKVENTIWLSTWRFGSLHIYAVVVICNSRLQIIMTNTLNMLPETVDNFAWPVNCEAVVVTCTDSAGLAIPNNGPAGVVLSLRTAQNVLSPCLPARWGSVTWCTDDDTAVVIDCLWLSIGHCHHAVVCYSYYHVLCCVLYSSQYHASVIHHSFHCDRCRRNATVFLWLIC